MREIKSFIGRIAEKMSAPNDILWDFESHDLAVDVGKLKENKIYKVDGIADFVSRGTCVGEVHFVPLGYDSFSPEIRTIAIWYLYKGLSDFIDYIDSSERSEDEPKPELIYGDTNLQMAEFSQRFGFEKTDGTFNDEGDVGVVAKIDNVRKSLAEISTLKLNGHSFIELLHERAEKELDYLGETDEDMETQLVEQGKSKRLLADFLTAGIAAFNSYDSTQKGDELEAIVFGLVAGFFALQALMDVGEIIINRKKPISSPQLTSQN